HDSCALLDICVLPGQVRAVSGGDGAFDLSIGRLGEGFDELAGGGVLDTVVRHGMQLLAARRELGGSGARTARAGFENVFAEGKRVRHRRRPRRRCAAASPILTWTVEDSSQSVITHA